MRMIIETVQDNKISALADQYGLNMLLLFGSEARGKTHKGSDIDIAFSSSKDLPLAEQSQLAMDLTNIFQRDDIEIVNLKTASPTLMRAVARDGILMYEAKENTFLKWKLYVTKIWMETSWLRSMRDKKLKAWAAIQA